MTNPAAATDESVTSSTTLQNDDDLLVILEKFGVHVGRLWHFDLPGQMVNALGESLQMFAVVCLGRKRHRRDMLPQLSEQRKGIDRNVSQSSPANGRLPASFDSNTLPTNLVYGNAVV